MRSHHVVVTRSVRLVRKSGCIALSRGVVIEVTSGEVVVRIQGVALFTQHYELISPVPASQELADVEFGIEVDLDVELSNPLKRSLQVEFLSHIGDLESELLV